MATRVPSPQKSAINWLLIGGSLVTLFIWASIEDPFNAPKSWILYCTGLWLLGYIGFEVKKRWADRLDRQTLIFAGAFALTLLGAF